MLTIEITTLDDERLAPYRELKNPGARGPETIIAEGEKLVRRLLESSCRVESVLCTTAAAELLRDVIPVDLPVYIAPTTLISQLIGFKFHRGALACGVRPAARGLETLREILRQNGEAMIIVCPEIRDPDNLGTIIRTAAAFGARAIVVGQGSTRPFSRRVMRTSMGAVLRLPVIETDDWKEVFATLHAEDCTSVATVLDPTADLLGKMPRPTRVALVFGNEDQGLTEDLAGRCQHRLTMPMADGVDSLNVAVAAGIFMHHFGHHT
jgi:tRNA G18 (ribose-2'-O)-methylase SpoU